MWAAIGKKLEALIETCPVIAMSGFASFRSFRTPDGLKREHWQPSTVRHQSQDPKPVLIRMDYHGFSEATGSPTEVRIRSKNIPLPLPPCQAPARNGEGRLVAQPFFFDLCEFQAGHDTGNTQSVNPVLRLQLQETSRTSRKPCTPKATHPNSSHDKEQLRQAMMEPCRARPYHDASEEWLKKSS